MHSRIWETVADALFWLQLGWIFSGFLLMAYLAFKVFPGASKLSNVQEYGNALGMDPGRRFESPAQSLKTSTASSTERKGLVPTWNLSSIDIEYREKLRRSS